MQTSSHKLQFFIWITLIQKCILIFHCQWARQIFDETFFLFLFYFAFALPLIALLEVIITAHRAANERLGIHSKADTRNFKLHFNRAESTYWINWFSIFEKVLLAKGTKMSLQVQNELHFFVGVDIASTFKRRFNLSLTRWIFLLWHFVFYKRYSIVMHLHRPAPSAGVSPTRLNVSLKWPQIEHNDEFQWEMGN